MSLLLCNLPQSCDKHSLNPSSFKSNWQIVHSQGQYRVGNEISNRNLQAQKKLGCPFISLFDNGSPEHHF